MINTKELRRLAQAATPGPWEVINEHRFPGVHGGDVILGGSFCDYVVPTDDDQEFIAAANPAAISELLDRLEAVEKERDAARQELVRLVTPTAYRWRYRGAIKWQYGELTEEGARLAKEHNHEVQPLYTLPGAKGE